MIAKSFIFILCRMGEWKSIEQIVKFAENLTESTIEDQRIKHQTGILKEGPSKGASVSIWRMLSLVLRQIAYLPLISIQPLPN